MESIGPDPGQSGHSDSIHNGESLPSVPSTSGGHPVTDEEQAEDQEEFFFSLLLNSQARRMDEQRCILNENITASTGVPIVTATATTHSLNPTSSAVTSTVSYPPTTSSSVPLHLDQVSEEAFFDLIEGVQVRSADNASLHC